MNIAYIRVSTIDQNEERQIKAMAIIEQKVKENQAEPSKPVQSLQKEVLN